MSWWIPLMVVAAPFIVFWSVKLGVVAFYRGRDWYFKSIEIERKNNDGDQEKA